MRVVLYIIIRTRLQNDVAKRKVYEMFFAYFWVVIFVSGLYWLITENIFFKSNNLRNLTTD